MFVLKVSDIQKEIEVKIKNNFCYWLSPEKCLNYIKIIQKELCSITCFHKTLGSFPRYEFPLVCCEVFAFLNS